MLSLLFTPIVRRLAIRYKFVSFPKQDRWRKRLVASLGGSAIAASFFISYLIFIKHDLISMGFAFGALGVFWLGFVDDIINIKPDTKLIGQIVIACIVIMFGIQFNLTSSPLINVPLTILWVVGIINAFNLLDNMDGLCAGIAVIAAFMMCIHSIFNNNIQLAVFFIIIIGATLGFLKYNFNPAKIFMGDCGSMFLGYTLAAGALMGKVTERSELLLTMAIPVLILTVPIFDTIFVTLTRTLNNRPISQGGKDHTSHRLVLLGLSEKKAVLLLYLISGICGAGAVLYDKLNFIHMSVFVAIIVVGLFIFGVFLSSEVKVYLDEDTNGGKDRKRPNGKIFLNGFIYNKRRIMEVILDFILISVSYILAFILRFEGVLFGLNMPLIIESLPIVVIIKLLMFYSFGLYRGVWRYIGLYDVIAIFKATSISSILSVVALVFFFRFRYYSRTVFVIDWILTFIAVSGVRMLFRLYKEFFANLKVAGRRILIFGAGDLGEMALREIRQNRALPYKAIGFIDDDPDKIDRIIHGIKVLGKGNDLEKLIYRYKIDEILIAIPISAKKRYRETQDTCTRTGISCKEVSKIIQIEK